MIPRTLTVMLLLALVTLVAADVFALPTSLAQTTVWTAESVSFRSASGGDVYPGSRNARLAVIARYNEGVPALNPVACLIVPSNFEVVGPSCVAGRDADGAVVAAVQQGHTVYFYFNVNVGRNVGPGQYMALLNITYYLQSKGTQSEVIEISLNVSGYPFMKVSLEEAHLTPYGYAGACPVNVVVGIKNNGDTSINTMRLILRMPGGLADPNEVNHTYVGTVNPKETVYIEFRGVCINPQMAPGQYDGTLVVKAELLTSDGVNYEDQAELPVLLEVSEPPTMKLLLLSYEVTSGSKLPGFKNTGIRLLVRSIEPGVLTITHSRVLLENAEFTNGSTSAVYVHGITLNYLDSAAITYSGISVKDIASYVKANIEIHGSVTRGGTEYPVSLNALIVIPLEQRFPDIRIVKVNWEHGYAYSNSTDNTLLVTLFNSDPSLSLVDAVVEAVISPENITYPSRFITRNLVLNPGSFTELTFTGITIPGTTKPGMYTLKVYITGVLRGLDGSYRFVSLIYDEAKVAITDIFNLTYTLPAFRVLNYFWGEGSPQYVYPGNARAALTVAIQNTGSIIAQNVLLTIRPLSGDIKMLSNASPCAAVLAPGSWCSATFYADLSASMKGLKVFNIAVEYTAQDLGVTAVFKWEDTISLYLSEHPAGSGVIIAGHGWLNNNPVFPRSKGATLSLTLANLEAYSVHSMWVTLKTPACMSIREGFPGMVYVAGPLAPLQVTTITFTLDLNDCAPGHHVAVVDVNYYLQVAGGGTRKNISQQINLYVESDESGIEYITSGWVTAPLNPPVYGAQYYIVFRNAKFPSITGPVLKLYLPKGIVESKTNSSEPEVLPTYTFTAQQAYMVHLLPSSIAQLLTQYMQQQPQIGRIEKGDFVTYVISLNIELSDTSMVEVPYTMTFIDQWGQMYSVSSKLAMKVVTTPPLIEMYPLTPLIAFKNGTAIMDVVVENKYNTVVGNAYLALVPVSGNVIPQNAIKYVGNINANASVVVRFELVYNPVQIMVGTVPASMSSAVFTATLLYVDSGGALHTMNTTLAAMIKPFIELILMPGAAARYSKGSLVVNGVLANTGISSARSVVVYLRYNDSQTVYIVGDVDSASQAPFRIELRAPYGGENCTLLIRYRDDYGSEYSLTEELEVIRVTEVEEVTVTPEQLEGDNMFRLIVVSLVAVFLVGAFYMIYRHSRRVAKGL